MRLLTVLFALVISTSLFGQDPMAGRYTFVFLNTNEDRAELPKAQVDSLQAGHMDNINRLVKARKMIAAGPFYGGGGIFLFDTNLEQTQAVLDTDPAVAAGRFKLEVIPFNMEMGKICTLWDVPEETIEMTTYFIVRYTNKFETDGAYAAKTNRFTLTHLKKLQKELKDIEILSDMAFDGNQGQVVIFKGTEAELKKYESAFGEHKLVKNGIMDFYLRQIYFPKGVFCEK
ncbi:YciI family protein [Roseivirga sp. E12]|uniref:YciI family protein n=1 Tax=Roseivirga sp. E12 TaxID=2819237 RepID=UPI001ABCD30F|nr:hypothetical protein [Roseivirga sp. E12]MBO3697173.1 hypothetical protein [Roseivirga sp. E12]